MYSAASREEVVGPRGMGPFVPPQKMSKATDQKLQRTAFFVALASVALLIETGCGSGASSSPSAPSGQAPVATPTPNKLNIVVVMTDDQEAVSAREMPLMQNLIASQGVTFANAISTTPLCGPSRATIMSGRYAHNHGVLSND